jgi:hypothetical protein
MNRLRSTTRAGCQILSDGVTVWVNAEGGLIGRFGRAGIDIHRVLGEQCEGECLYCTHNWTTTEDWPVFVAKMRELHGVAVPEKHRPKRMALKTAGGAK